MRIKNKAKAIKKANEYIDLLRTRYSRNDVSYLYINTWVVNAIEFDLIENLQINRKDGWYHPKTEWDVIIKSIDDAVRCTRIDPKIKDNAMLILSNPDLMKIYDEIIKCFE